MIHPLSSLPNTVQFSFDGLQMCFFKGHRHTIEDLATRFAPLILNFGDRFEINWAFYSTSPSGYQEKMNLVLMALGVLSPCRDNSLRVGRKTVKDDETFMPEIYGTKLYFVITRIHDALSFVSVASETFRRHGMQIASSELEIEQCQEASIEKFEPNRVNGKIIITGDSRIAC
jgi:hypothetical protein